MAKVRNTMALIEKSHGIINENYDMNTSNMVHICVASKDAYDLITNGFRFGYMQGLKAARAEMRIKKQRRHT